MKASIANEQDIKKLRIQKGKNVAKIAELQQDNKDIDLRLEQIRHTEQNQISLLKG